MVTLEAWRKLTPFRQGYLRYMQGLWSTSEIADQQNPYAEGSDEWGAFRQGEQHALSDAQYLASLGTTPKKKLRGAHCFEACEDGALIIWATMPDGDGEPIRIVPQRVGAVLAACGDALARTPSRR